MYEKYCNINRGEIKITNNQFKKHRLQMTDKELYYLSSQLCQMKRVRFCHHALCKAMYFNKKDIVDYLLNNTDFTPDIVEYNVTLDDKARWEKRVLLRLPQEHIVKVNNQYPEKCSLCVVVSYMQGRIVTAYYNIKDDKHNTLDPSRYCAGLKIL